jgi:hypothetical protein
MAAGMAMGMAVGVGMVRVLSVGVWAWLARRDRRRGREQGTDDLHVGLNCGGTCGRGRLVKLCAENDLIEVCGTVVRRRGSSGR